MWPSVSKDKYISFSRVIQCVPSIINYKNTDFDCRLQGSEALDLVDHNILVAKLYNYGIELTNNSKLGS